MRLYLAIIWATVQVYFAESSYLVSFPNSLIPGIPLNIRVHVLKSTGNVNVNMKLEHSSNSSMVVETNMVAQEGLVQHIPLTVPMDLPQSVYKISITGSGGLSFTNESRIYFESNNLHIFIQTDKTRYSAGQEVKYRAIFLLPNLIGYGGETFISITDGKNKKIQFDGPFYPVDGVVSGAFTLSRQPNFGDWTITASAKDRHVSKGITVNDYVLPKFIVDIKLESEIKKTDTSLNIGIDARYTFKSDVFGTCTLQIYSLQQRLWSTRSRMGAGHRKMGGTHMSNYVIVGSVNFTIPMSNLKNKLYIDSEIKIRALVTDNATALTMAAEKELKFSTVKHNGLQPITISQVYEQKYFVPGLKYYSMIFIGRDGEPFGTPGRLNVSVTVTTAEVKPCVLNNPPTTWLDVQTSTLSPFDIPFDEYGLAALEFMLSPHTETVDVKLTHGYERFDITLNPAVSTSITMMRIYPDTTSPRTGDRMTFTMASTGPLTGQLQVEVVSRGTIIEQAIIQLSSQKSAQFIIHITERMVPDVHVLTTHVTQTGLLISDEIYFKVHGLPFLNKFDSDTLQPGQTVQMTLTADPNSTVYVLSEDEQNRLLGSENDIYLYEVKEKIVSSNYNIKNNILNYPKQKRSTDLEQQQVALQTNSNSTTHNEYRSYKYRSLGSYSDTDDMIIISGVIILTDVQYIEVNHAQDALSQTSTLPRKCVMITATTPASTAPTPAPSQTYAPGIYPTYIPAGMLPTLAPGFTYSPNLIPTPAPGQTYAPGIYPAVTAGPAITPMDVIRSRFPETWLWSEYLIGPSGKETIALKVPDSMTSWVSSVFATNPTTGFGISDLKPKITVKKDFFVTMDLPDSIILGEEFLLQITVFNYLNSMQQVFLQIVTSDKPNNQIPAATVVQPGQGHSTYVHITPNVTGPIEIDVVAKAGFFSNSVTDHMKKNVTVMPTGVKKQKNEAQLVSVSSSSIFAQAFLLTDPPHLVSGTKSSKVRITGNFMVPSIDGLQNLIRMPYGCGEQTMLNFAPDIYITKYLQSARKLTKDVERKAIDVLKSGLQRELTYQHFDGSFSAFGNRDSSGSSWLTAFVIKCFRQAGDLLKIDEAIIAEALTWLLKYQRIDGSFYEPGRVIHTQMQAGTSSGMKLTAFILISVLENRQVTGVDINKVNLSIRKGKEYLEGQLNSVRDMYTLGIVCYALAKAGSAKQTTCFTKLTQASSLDGEKMYWVAKEPITKRRASQQLPTRALSADIEATAYALMTYMEMGKLGDAFPIVKWLVGQRNPTGGFQSTQDTVISLQALAAYSSAATSPPSSYSITFNAYSGAFNHMHSITQSTIDVVHEFELPDSSPNVLLQGMGAGVANVEVIMTYFVAGDQSSSKLALTSSVTQESLNSITVNVCITWKDASASGMIVAEVETPTGFGPDTQTLKSQTIIKRHETNGRQVALYFDGFSPSQTVCVDVKMDREDPVVKSQACHITVYDYYEPTNQARTRYESGLLKSSNICDVCPLCGFCSGSSGLGLVG